MGFINTVRVAYRVYGLLLLGWAAWSVIWLAFGLKTPPTTIATGWLLLAIYGGTLTLVLVGTRFSSQYTLFQTAENRTRIQRFNNHILSSTPLHLYVIALAAWSFITIEWWILTLDIIGQTIVAYGWFLLALYGLVLTIGLSVKHKDDIVEELPDAIT